VGQDFLERGTMSVKKVKVGSEWVAKVDNPRQADVLKGDRVIVSRVDAKYVYYTSGTEIGWVCSPEVWGEHFSPVAGGSDNVNSPSHYGQGKIEAIEYISDFLTKEEYQGYLRGNIAKYLHRFPYKNGLEDLKKAQWYLGRLIEEVEKKNDP
jgi:hypothetical protein